MPSVCSRRLWCNIGLGFVFAANAAAAQVPIAAPLQAPAHDETFAPGQVSPAARMLVEWVYAQHDNRGLPVVIVDKTAARVYAIDPAGRLAGDAPALLGVANGDNSPPGIGERALAAIPPQDRITPAGRFAAALGKDLAGKTVLWVDYGAGLALHPVITTNPAEHRLERLATPTTADNRISYGCINVPAQFFDAIVQPLFRESGGMVYILPEVRSIESVFWSNSAAQTDRPPTAIDQHAQAPFDNGQ